jgi:outer membrane cobalamin receptor
MALVFAVAGLVSTPAIAEDSDQKATQLEKVEVTGTRIKRTDLETAAPVTTISRAQIDRTGATSLSDMR